MLALNIGCNFTGSFDGITLLWRWCQTDANQEHRCFQFLIFSVLDQARAVPRLKSREGRYLTMKNEHWSFLAIEWTKPYTCSDFEIGGLGKTLSHWDEVLWWDWACVFLVLFYIKMTTLAQLVQNQQRMNIQGYG